MKYEAYAFIGWTGREAERFELEWAGEMPAQDAIRIEGPAVDNDRVRYLKETRGVAPGDITQVSLEDGVLKITVVPVNVRAGFALVVNETRIERDDFILHTRTLDDQFEKVEEGDVLYRLYTPKAKGKRPLILFLHGGGNGGYAGERDNEKHVVADYGCVNFAEKYPDIYVMAPQAVEARRDLKKMNMNRSFASADQNNVPGTGWCREYLASVIDIIRRMIDEGKVDEKRVYVTGLSMGGAGTLRAMSVGSDLFAACLPVCPTMTPETFSILKSIRRPIWVMSAYIDHTLYRHKYLVDGVLALKDAGHKNARLTLFSPEELQKYDIAITPDLPYVQLFGENHASWVLAYNNEYGAMSWLLNQTKDD